MDRREIEVFKALGSESRLQILECIEGGVVNPGEIAEKLERPRSTVEKHLRVLLRAGLVEKVPDLSRKGNLRVIYRVNEVTHRLRKTLRDSLASGRVRKRL